MIPRGAVGYTHLPGSLHIFQQCITGFGAINLLVVLFLLVLHMLNLHGETTGGSCSGFAIIRQLEQLIWSELIGPA